MPERFDYFAATLKGAPFLFLLMKMPRFKNMTPLVSFFCGFLAFFLFTCDALAKENLRKTVPRRTPDPNTCSITDRQFFEETQNYLGTRYRKGGATKAGLDCSGFVRLIYQKVFDLDLPRNAREQHGAPCFEDVPQDSLKTGDLVFFSSGGKKKQITHVGIYLSKGEFIHAATRKGVTISNLKDSYWKARYHAAKRLTDPKPSAPGVSEGFQTAGLSYSIGQRSIFSFLFTEAPFAGFSLGGPDGRFGDPYLLEPRRSVALGYTFRLLDDSWSAHIVAFRDYYFEGQRNPFQLAGLKMEAFDPYPVSWNNVLEAPYVEGFRVDSPFRPNEWVTINPSIIYFTRAYGMDNRDIPKVSLGLDVILASSMDRWSFSTALQYPIRDHSDRSHAFASNEQGFDLSLSYRQWLTNRTQLSIVGENRMKLSHRPQTSSNPFDRQDSRFSLMLNFFY
jgi:hypothetical protein